jgi:hypothetical protein
VLITSQTVKVPPSTQHAKYQVMQNNNSRKYCVWETLSFASRGEYEYKKGVELFEDKTWVGGNNGCV